MDSRTIVVLEGDQTGQELLEEGLRVLQPDVIGLSLSWSASTSRGAAARDEERGGARGGAGHRGPGWA